MSRSGEQGVMGVRRKGVLDFVIENGCAQIDELAERFNASRMTMHRDIQALVGEGLLRKVRGGVSTLANGTVESSLLHRRRRAAVEKRAIAAQAAKLVSPGEIILLDDSTTAALLADHLVRVTPLTVVTNSLGIASRLSACRNIDLIALGGQYRPTYDAFFGTLCETAIQALRGNTLFMSVSAIHGMTAYHQEQDVIKVKLAMMSIVAQRILLVDSLKFDVCALNRLTPLASFDLIITDPGIPPNFRAELEESGISLLVAPLPPDETARDALDAFSTGSGNSGARTTTRR